MRVHPSRTAWLPACLVLVFVCASLAQKTRLEQVFHVEFLQLALDFRPFWLTLSLAISPLLIHFSRNSWANLSRSKRRLLIATRLGLVGLLGLALGSPIAKYGAVERTTVLLVDVSPSMPDASLRDADRFAAEYEAHRLPTDDFQTAVFDATFRKSSGSFLAARRSSAGHRPGSDYGQALRRAMGLSQDNRTRRIILLGDGQDTRSGMWPAVEELRNQGFELHVVARLPEVLPDVSVSDLEVPSTIVLGTPFSVRGKIHSTRAASVRVMLKQDGKNSPRESEKTVELRPGSTPVAFETVATREGLVPFALRIMTDGNDAFPENDVTTAVASVDGPPRILIVDSQPDAIANFSRALEAQKLRVQVEHPSTRPLLPEKLTPYAVVVLSNVSASRVGPEGANHLLSWVRQGGILLFSGGPEGYANGGWPGTKLESILPVSMNVPKAEAHHDVALVLAIDRSGSMTGLPLQLAKTACAATVDALRPTDMLEVLAFDAKPTRYVPMQVLSHKAAVAREISRISAGGDTELFFALDLAYQDLVAVEAQRKHVILLTDGQSPTRGLSEVVQGMVADNITLTTVGLGETVDADLLRHLAERGGGRYHAAPNPESLPRIFIREAEQLVHSDEGPSSYRVRVSRNADFLREIDVRAIPHVFGYHRTSPKGGGSEVILESDRREPLLARVRADEGWAVAWTSDLHPRWAKDMLAWPSIGKLFAQLIRAHQEEAPRAREYGTVRASRHDDEVEVVFDFVRADGSFDNERIIELSLVGDAPSGTESPSPLRLTATPTAPGTYEARFTLPHLGDYRLIAKHHTLGPDGERQEFGTIRTPVSWSYPDEFAPKGSSEASLAALRRRAGTEPAEAARLARARPLPTMKSVAVWGHVLFLATLCFLAELALKRHRPHRNAL